MSAAQDTREALHQALQATIKGSSSLVTAQRANVLRNVALAYRLLEGGPQPGGAIAAEQAL